MARLKYWDGSAWQAVSIGGATSQLQHVKVTRTAGDLTYTSATFADVTGMSITLTTGARRCLVTVVATVKHTTNTYGVAFDIDIDGTRMGGANTWGLIKAQASGSGYESPLAFSFLTDALTAGSHTFKLQAATDGATGTVYASDPPLVFAVSEVPSLEAGGAFAAPVAPGQVAYVKAATNYTAASDSFADVDATNLAITKTFTGARHARICVALTGQSSVASGAIGFDIDIDGTRLLNTTYGQVFNMGTNTPTPISFCLITASALAAGAHTFKLQWRKVGAITATALGSGVYPVTMNVEELAS